MAEAPVFNPGEPVFDMTTGEPYIDADGAMVEVAPGLKVETPDGRTLDGDDVVNAAYYRANMFEGESLRARSVGVPYLRLALGQSNIGLAIEVVVAEVRRRTPGIAGVVSVAVEGLDRVGRVLRWSARFIKQRGAGEVSASIQSGG